MITELVFWNNPETPVQGWSLPGLSWPGACFSASCIVINGTEILPTDAKVRYARWLITWTPNTVPGALTGAYLMWGDEGPANIAQVASILSSSLTADRLTEPNPSAVDITAFFNMLLGLGQTKILGIQTLGTGSAGPLIYGSKIELVWAS